MVQQFHSREPVKRNEDAHSYKDTCAAVHSSVAPDSPKTGNSPDALTRPGVSVQGDASERSEGWADASFAAWGHLETRSPAKEARRRLWVV